MANWKTSCFTPPWRRSGVGLKRCSGSPEGLPAEQVADTFQVSRQTVYNWAEHSADAKGSTSGHASSTPHARAALP